MPEDYILNKLSAENVDIKVKTVKTTGSTNDDVKAMAENGYKDDFVLISEEQTKGKGRKGRSFYSPDGTGIYISFLLHPEILIKDAQRLTTMAAVAAAVAIENETEQDVSIKWVNDLWMHGKKISGILTEASPSIQNGIPEYVVVGIGINIFEPKEGFPDEIKDTAGAVFMNADSQDGAINNTTGSVRKNSNEKDIYGNDPGIINSKNSNIKFDITAGLIIRFMEYYAAEFGNYDIMSTYPAKSNSNKSTLYSISPCYIDEYKKRLFIIGRDVELLSPDHKTLKKKVHVLGINDKCHLHIRYEDGTEEYLSSGEISIRL